MPNLIDQVEEFENYEEPSTVTGDNEYQIRILRVTRGPSKNGSNPDLITVFFEFPEHPNAFAMRHWLSPIFETDDSSTKDRKKKEIHAFKNTFGFESVTDLFTELDQTDASGEYAPNQEAFVGKEAWAIIGEKFGKGQYADTKSNYIKRFV